MNVDNWQETTLGDFVTLQRGHDLPDQERRSGKVPIIGSAGITGYHDTAIAKGPGVTVGRSGASFGVVTYSPVDYWPHNACLYVIDFHGNDERFAYYYLKSLDFSSFNSGSAQPSLNRNFIHPIKIIVPPILEQRAIAWMLGALDDKIELNRRMNRTLESMARAVFRQWFVEDEEVGDWEVGKLGDVITNFDSKRVPVANRERAQRQGKYPYYGAASVMDYVDDYLFDGIYVLMGEDGSVVDDEGHPVIQYVWGKIWVNNHAHVLQGTSGICNEHLYLFLKDVNILPYVTGAVQPKINQANMNSIPFPLPPMELRKKFEEFVSPLFAKIRANDEESRTLASLRDSLLPKLMRGEVRVKI